MNKTELIDAAALKSGLSRERKARTGRNPFTGAKMDIAARKVVKFTAGSALKL